MVRPTIACACVEQYGHENEIYEAFADLLRIWRVGGRLPFVNEGFNTGMTRIEVSPSAVWTNLAVIPDAQNQFVVTA